MADGRTGARTVQAEMSYFKSSIGKPSFGTPRDAQNSWETETRVMTFHDASSWADKPTLDREGLTLFPFKTKVTDFRDREQLKSVYVPELEELMRQATGAKYAVGFSQAHMRFSKRRPDEVAGFSRPASLAHVDVTLKTAPGIGHNPIFPSAPEVLKPGQRLVGYNVWRVVSDPPHDIPLAVCDQRTVDWDDLVASDGIAGSEAYLVRHNPKHRWIYFRDMTPGDALIFRAYETNGVGPVPVPHAAFIDPSCPADAPGRISVEARVYVIFDQ